MSSQEFIAIVLSANSGNIREDRNIQETRITLVGLHTCGDLASTMLKVFVTCPEIKALVSVACCYMKMSVTENDRKIKKQLENKTQSKRELLEDDKSTINLMECNCNIKLNDKTKNVEDEIALDSCRCQSEYRRVNRTVYNMNRNPSESRVSGTFNSNHRKYEKEEHLEILSEQTDNTDDLHSNLDSPPSINNLDSRSPPDIEHGYPLSSFLKGFPLQPLGLLALELACHSFDYYCEKTLGNW